MTERTRPRRVGPGPVLWGSVALFAVVFALLTYRLSASEASASASSSPTVVRKVLEHRIVTTVVPEGAEPESSVAEAAEPEAETAPTETFEAPEPESEPVTTGAS